MRGLVIPDFDEDFTADEVELYFDLAFVFAFSQLIAYLHGGHSFATTAKAVLILLLIWWPWTQFTWSANAISSSARVVRGFFLVATMASMPMSASVTTAFEGGGLVFALSMSLIFLMAIAGLVSSIDDRTLQANTQRYALPTYVAIAVVVGASLLDAQARIVGWLVAVAIFVYSTIRAGDSEWVIRPGHFAERHGLIVIIALGEIIVAIGIPLVKKLTEDGRIGSEMLAAVALAGIFAGLLWWAYFDRVAKAFEYAAEQLTDRKERGRFARDVYSYGHVMIVGGVLFAAAALEEITAHPADPLDDVFRVMFLGGIAAFLGAIAGGVWRAFRVVATERLIALAVIAAVVLLLPQISGLAMLAIVDFVLLVMLIAEHLRIEGAPASASTTDAAA